MPPRDTRQTSHQRGYTYKWQKARAGFLKRNPLCVYHQRLNEVVAATVVDHITPHRGDMKLFWDKANWQSLCDNCHSSLKQSEEGLGYSTQVDVHGYPIDEKHPANVLELVNRTQKT